MRRKRPHNRLLPWRWHLASSHGCDGTAAPNPVATFFSDAASKVQDAATGILEDATAAAQAQVDNAIEEAKAVPAKLQSAAQAKVDETIESIKAVPITAKNKAVTKTQATVLKAQARAAEARYKLEAKKRGR